jgi:bifunctional oligoribonuclease and PAP phosphatase NrnA
MADPVEAVAPARPATSLEAELDRAARVLADAPRVALTCHVNPDPDALGSMLGLALTLADRGVEVVCSWGNEPLVRPRWLSLLGGESLLVDAKDFPAAPEVMVSLDTASADRLGRLAANAARAGEWIVVDHHRTNPGFGSILVLDPAASSTAELVVRLIERMGATMPPAAAAGLYAGIVTDTGRFQYEATTPATLRAAAALREFDFDHAALARGLYEDGSFGYLRVMAAALGRAVLDPEADLVWTYLTQPDIHAAGVTMGDTDDLIDVVRTAREADVACVIKQQRDGRFKVSLRSRGGTDVGRIAADLGGGGHRLAAGYTARAGLEETVRELSDALVSARGG